MHLLRSQKVQFLLALLIPILIIFIAYAPIYKAPFLLDDRIFLFEWPIMHDLTRFKEILQGALPPNHEGGYRPLRTLFESFSYHIFSTNPQPYHIQGVIVHALTTSIVFFTIMKLLRLFTKNIQLQNITLACLGATIFGLHPIATESVAYIQASFDTMGVMVAFLAYYLFLEALLREYKTFPALLCFGFSVFLAASAFLFYELTYTLPIFVFVTSYLYRTKNKPWLSSIPYFTMFACVILLRSVILNVPTGRVSYSPGAFFTFLASTRAVCFYILQTIFPSNLTITHEVASGISSFVVQPSSYEKLHLTDVPTLIGIAAVGVMCLCLFVIKKKMPFMTVGLIWFFIGLTPVLNIFVQGTIYAERYLYFPLFGFVLIILSILIKTKTKNWIIILCIILIGIIYGKKTYLRTQEWANPIEFWTKEIKHLPYIDISHNALGAAYFHEELFAEAFNEYAIAIQLQPSKSEYYHNASITLIRLGEYAKAQKYANQALQLEPTNQKIFQNVQRTRMLSPNQNN